MAYLYMAVTADEWEWPVAIATSSFELDKMLGRCRGWAATRLCRDADGHKRTKPFPGGYHVYKIEVEDDEEWLCDQMRGVDAGEKEPDEDEKGSR